MEHKSICICLQDFLVIYNNILKENDNATYILGDKNNLQFKIYNKIHYNESSINNKIEIDNKNFKKHIFV